MSLILNSYVLREVLRWYAAGIALFLILQLTDALSTSVGLLLSYNATLLQAAKAFGNYAPTFLNRSLVLAVPFAMLLTLGRLQGDSELKAIFAAGVRPLSLVWPLALPFALVGLVAFVNAGYVAPDGLVRWNQAWSAIYKTVPHPPARDNYTYAPPGALYYAGRVSNDSGGAVANLEGVLIERGDEMITAQSGTWDTRRKTWTVRNAWITRPGQDPRQVTAPLVFHQTDTLRPPPSSAEQVSTPELQARLASRLGTPQERRQDTFELTRRYVDPLTPVVFALAAGALGLLLRSRAAGFAATVVFLVSFYVLWVSMPSLARAGAIAPVLAAWLPNLVFLFVAGLLAWRLR